MAWSASAIFRSFLEESFENTQAFDLNSDAPKVALYDNDITPDKDAAETATRYDTGQWASSGNEVSESGQWATAGVALTSPAVTTPTSGAVMFDASDTASGSAADLTNVYGCLVYDDTIANDPGICYNYFGGANSVVNGTFTVVWHANGIFRITV